MQRVSIDPSNYEKPISQKKSLVSNKLDSYIYKEITIRLMTVEVHTDYGWLFNDIQKASLLDVLNIEIDVNSQSGLGNNKNLLDSTYFYYHKDQVIYKRSISKIQKLAAEIGGIIKLLTTIASFIVGLYKNLYYEFDIVKQWINGELINKIDSEILNPSVTNQEVNKIKKVNIVRQSIKNIKSFKILPHKSSNLNIKAKDSEEMSFNKFLLSRFLCCQSYKTETYNKISSYINKMKDYLDISTIFYYNMLNNELYQRKPKNTTKIKGFKEIKEIKGNKDN